MIHITGPNWPSKRTLVAALATVHHTGNITIPWGNSPCDKLEALEKFANAGLNVPDIKIGTAPVNTPELRWIGRSRTHSKGRDILFPPSSIACRSYREAYAHKDFYVRLIPSVHEFRIHVWGERAFRTGFKKPTSLTQRDQRLKRVVRASTRGWELCYSHEELCNVLSKDRRKELRQVARDACRALGVLGGAVDVLLGEDNKFYVLELNTAPALGEHTLTQWVGVLTEWISQQVPNVAPVVPPPASAAPEFDTHPGLEESW